MGSRQLRRLALENTLKAQTSDVEGEEEEEESQIQPRNSYAFLQEDGSGQEEPEETAHEEAPPFSTQQKEQAPRKSSKRSQKEEKRRKGGPKREEENLDELLESLNINIKQKLLPDASTATPSPGALVIQARKLKPEDELVGIFGKRFISSEARGDDEGRNFAHGSRRVRRLAARGLIKNVQLKPGFVIQPRSDWPMPDGALAMSSDVDAAGVTVFNYVRTPAYRVAQALFEQAQASYDPNQLLSLLQHQPYHADTLLAASELYRASGQLETSEDLLARCMYALEICWPATFLPGFSIIGVDAEENWPLFTTMFRYIQSLVRRGLYTTALENAKLLLTFNLADPAGVLTCIDYIAIKAGNYPFIQELQSLLDPNGDSFSALPNWSYSNALVQQFQGLQQQQGGALSTGGLAVVQFPMLVIRLLKKLEDKGVHGDSELKQILKHKLFADAREDENASLTHLITIYVERQYTLYKEGKVLSWLKQWCKEATSPQAEMQLKDWEAMREEIWPVDSNNSYSYLRLAAFTDDVAALPAGDIPAGMGQPGHVEPAGGMVPADAQGLDNAVHEANAIVARYRPGEEMSDEDAQRLHPLMALLETLLPWNNFGQDPNGEGREGPG